VLASYRGYDTFGETIVVFTAGVAVLVLLKNNTNLSKQKNKKSNRKIG
jgi:multicomponent Na+:H+ antiporter subunit B